MTTPPAGGRRVHLTVNMDPLEGAVRAVSPRDSDLPRILRGLQAMAIHYWKSAAQSELRSTSRDYVAAIGPGPTTTDGSLTVQLASDNKIVDMVENGFKGGDMRSWMFTSKKTRTTKSGTKLLVIPFRHAAPGASGRNTGTPMPALISAAARKLLPTLSRPATDEDQRGGTAWVKGARGRLTAQSRGIKGNAQATAIFQEKSKPWHASSIYKDMIRKGQPTKTGVQTSGFTTFRTISSKPGKDPRSWFHPGIKGKKLAIKTQDHITKVAHEVIIKAMSSPAKQGNK